MFWGSGLVLEILQGPKYDWHIGIYGDSGQPLENQDEGRTGFMRGLCVNPKVTHISLKFIEVSYVRTLQGNWGQK